MSHIERKFRSSFLSLLGKQAIPFYSWSRRKFLDKLHQEIPEPYKHYKNLERKLWNITFRSHLLNAAEIFKTGNGYNLSYLQWAEGKAIGQEAHDSDNA